MERAYDPLETTLEERQLLKARSHQAVTPLLTKVESCKSAEVPLSTALSKDGCNDKGVGGEQEAAFGKQPCCPETFRGKRQVFIEVQYIHCIF